MMCDEDDEETDTEVIAIHLGWFGGVRWWLCLGPRKKAREEV